MRIDKVDWERRKKIQAAAKEAKDEKEMFDKVAEELGLKEEEKALLERAYSQRRQEERLSLEEYGDLAKIFGAIYDTKDLNEITTEEIIKVFDYYHSPDKGDEFSL